MIELADFSKIYGCGKNRFEAVSHVSFKAVAGNVTALLGLNGAGKTTILRSVCALHYASSGNVFISGNDNIKINAAVNSAAVKRLVGFVPEQSMLPHNMTVSEILDLSADIRNLTGKEKTTAVEQVIDECSIGSIYGERIGTLSKGYGQRVSFALALLGNPPNIVLDEPSSGLDPVQIIQIRNLIKKESEHKTVLLSTHILQEVSALCGSLIIISKGKIAAIGSEQEIIQSCGTKSFEEAFMKLTGAGNE